MIGVVRDIGANLGGGVTFLMNPDVYLPITLDTPGMSLALRVNGDPDNARRVLLEGGPTLAAAFLRAGLVDEALVHLAPTLFGAGPSLVGDLGIPTIADALTLTVADVTLLGGDVQVRLRPTRHTGKRNSGDGRS